MKEFLTKKSYTRVWGEGFRAGWKASLEEVEKHLKEYKEMERGFSEYEHAMDEAIELVEWLSGNKSKKLD